MATVRSRLARRGRTGRKATGTHKVRRRVTVHKHHHRRYAGIKGKPKAGARRKTGAKAVRRKSVRRRTIRATVRKKRVVRKGLHRKFKGRKKSLKPRRRAIRHAIHHAHKGSHTARRKGLKRHFYGRKRKKRTTAPAAAPISAASYLSMF